MKKIFIRTIIVILITFLLNPTIYSAPIDLKTDQYPFKENKDFSISKVIVKIKNNKSTMSTFSPNIFDGIDVESVEQLNHSNKTGGFSQKSLETQDIILSVTLKNKGKDQILSAIKKLNNTAGVIYAEPDYKMSVKTIPNDPHYSYLYGLNKISTEAAWDDTTGSSDILVGVIDTGIDIGHEDLRPNIWTNPEEIADNGIDDDGNGYIDDIHGWNFVANNNNVYDDNGHGTHVSGTIGAIANNGVGVVGIAWNVGLVALKVLDSSGYGDTSNIIKAIEYATANNIPVTNNSYGGGGYSQALEDTIAKSSLYIAAAGNDGRNNDLYPFYPASYDLDNIVSVAATNEFDNLSYFSNYGMNMVDIAAPGSNIYSSLPNNQYGSYSGTSMATPHVVGAAVLIKSKYPDYTTAQIKDALLFSTDKVQSLDYKVLTAGRLNADHALQPVTIIDPTGIGLSTNSVAISCRQTVQLSAVVSPADASDRRVLWASSNNNVATVSTVGLVRGISNGSCVITASLAANPTIKVECNVTVEGSINAINFVDMNFKSAVIDALKSYIPLNPSDPIGEYEDYTVASPLYLDDVEKLSTLSMNNRNISDLTGIAYFKNLCYLTCTSNNLTTLDVSALEQLNILLCSNNRLTNLDLNVNNNWRQISVHNNYLNFSVNTQLKEKLDLIAGKAAAVRMMPQLVYVPAQSISIGFDTLLLDKRETKQLKPIIYPQDTSNTDVVFGSSNPSVATVSQSGLICVLSTGTTKITATIKGTNISSVCNVTVSDSITPPIAFKDQEFKKEVIRNLAREFAMYSSYNVNSNLYPDDLCKLKLFACYSDLVTDQSEFRYLNGLTEIISYYHSAKEVDLSLCVNLTDVIMSNSKMEYLDAGDLKNLTYLNLYNNKLKDINLSGTKNLTILYIFQNQLTTLDLTSQRKLTSLNCSLNILKNINITELIDLEDFRCNDNYLTDLDVSDLLFLTTFLCQNNRLKNLNINPDNAWYWLECQNNYLDIFEDSPLRKNLDIIEKKIINIFKYQPQNPLPPVKPIEIYPGFTQMEIGEIAKLDISYNLGGITPGKIYWTYDKDGIVQVDESGNVTAINQGLVKLTATMENHPEINASCFVIVSSPFANGDGTAANPYEIKTDSDLKNLSICTTTDQADINRRYLQADYILNPQNGAYIDLDNQPMEPIGYGYGDMQVGGFEGVFNGNNKEIRNVKIEKTISSDIETAGKATGLFAYINGGRVHDLNIININILVNAHDKYMSGVGSLAGRLSNMAEIDRVNVTGSINCTGEAWKVGGFVGSDNYQCRITNCHANVMVKGYRTIGGFIGDTWGGSLCQNCTATGDVIGNSDVGGFVGQQFGDIKNCSAHGNITGELYYSGGFTGYFRWGENSDNGATGNVKGYLRVGGFVGSFDAPNFGEAIYNSYSTGKVMGVKSVGGFVGECILGKFYNNYAAGITEGHEDVGGFAGFFGDGTAEYNYSAGDIFGVDRVGGFIGNFMPLVSAPVVKYNFSASRVSGNNGVGGFVGVYRAALLDYAYASGDVTGISNVGGFVGLNEGTIQSHIYRVDIQSVSGATNTVGGVLGKTNINNSTFIDSLFNGKFMVQPEGLHPKVKLFDATGLVPNQPDLQIVPHVAKPTWASDSILGLKSIGQTQVSLTWSGAYDDQEVVWYCVYMNGEPKDNLDGSVYAVTIEGLSPGTPYVFKVEAGDADGNWSTDGPSLSVNTLGSEAKSVSGSVYLQGVSGYAGGVLVKLVNGIGEEVANTTTDALGRYSFSCTNEYKPIPEGTYGIIVSKPVFLTGFSGYFSVSMEDISLNGIKLFTGDVNNDNRIDISDLTEIAMIYGQTFECDNQENWLPDTDLNRDNKIDIFDFVLFAKNYGKEGFRP